jgi:hypothetical protein
VAVVAVAPDARYIRSMNALCVLLLLSLSTGCAVADVDDKPEFAVPWVSEKLRVAGYKVSAPYHDEHAPKIPAVARAECVDATKQGLIDQLCILECTDRFACRSTQTKRGPLGESYGQFHRGPTVLIHRRCGFRDCGAALDAILVLPRQ